MIEAIIAILMGTGLGIMLVIAIIVALIIFGFKALLWIIGIILAVTILVGSWYAFCRWIAKRLPKDTKIQRWFEKTGELKTKE